MPGEPLPTLGRYSPAKGESWRSGLFRRWYPTLPLGEASRRCREAFAADSIDANAQECHLIGLAFSVFGSQICTDGYLQCI